MDSDDKNDEIFVRGAVKLVEDDDFQAQPVLTFETGLLHAKWDGFKETANPVLALEAIMLAIQAGVYPPAETLRWLAGGLCKWHENQGESSLDLALGLTAGRGQVPHFKRLLMDERDEMLMFDMARLSYLGATREEAASMIASKLTKTDWNKTRHDIADLSAETLIAMHARLKPNYALERAKCLDDPRWVAEWLGTFDALYIPEKLKSML